MTNKEAIAIIQSRKNCAECVRNVAVCEESCTECDTAFDMAINALEERPKGEWIKWNFKTFGAMGDWEYKCSNCEKVYGGEYNFCPNCGAQMQKGGAE